VVSWGPGGGQSPPFVAADVEPLIAAGRWPHHPRNHCNYIPRGGTRLRRASPSLGDDTAWRLGRVTFNPLKHIDPVGTILLPGLLLFLHSPFLFGYAKPVPVNFRALRNPRRDMVLVAAAGPSINIVLALVAALTFHLVGYLPDTVAQWLAENLRNALIINVVLAVFNLLPLPPLDGGRIAVGLLPSLPQPMTSHFTRCARPSAIDTTFGGQSSDLRKARRVEPRQFVSWTAWRPITGLGS
jgi:Zn-dependent protease